MKLKWLLFDLDGTLIDSKKCVFAVYTKLFNELNIPIPNDNIMETFIGPPIEEIIVRYVYKNDVTKYSNRFREIYKTIDLEKNNKLFYDIPKMLETLKNDGYKMGICTTKNIRPAKQILELFNISHYFDFVAGSDAQNNIISKTDVLNWALNQGIDKRQSILIGDTKFDVEGAKNVNLPVAIVNYGFGRKEDFENENIVWFCDTVMEIVDKVKATEI